MSQDFYDLLNVTPNASTEDIRNAFRIRTAKLVKRLKSARQNNADTTVLYDTFKRLKAARNVLVDPLRRESYDTFRECIEKGIPSDIEQFWSVMHSSMTEPKLLASLKVLQQFTQLPIQQLQLINKTERLKPDDATTVPKIAIAKKAHASSLSKTTSSKKTKSDRNVRQAQNKAQIRTTPLPSKPLRGAFSNAQLEELASRIGYGGRFLRTVREHLNISKEDVFSKTRIPIQYIHAIENDAFDQLPSTTFVKGYIQSISKLLRIEHMPVVLEYMNLYKSHR